MTTPEKAKTPPPPSLSQLSKETLVETIDGPVPIVELLGKTTPVLTRGPGEAFGFRMMREIRVVAEDQPLLRLTNPDGQEVVVGADHVFLHVDGREIRAVDLRPGDRLESSWSYPSGYLVPDAPEYALSSRGTPWEAGVVVVGIEAVGRGPVIGLSVNQTKAYYLTFGARSRAQR